MRINGFVWLPDIVDKIEHKHHLDQDEVEEVFFNRPRYSFVERGHRTGEDVFAATGQTDAGRYIIVNRILHLEEKWFRLDSKRTRYGRTRAKTP